MIRLKLINSKEKAIVDNKYKYLKNFKLYLSPNGYIRTTINGKREYLHRIILWVKLNSQICCDHINSNKLDNREQNLRIATYSQNIANKKPRNIKKYSKYKGVSYSKDGQRKKRWMASCEYKDKNINVGRYLTEKEAAIAYNKKAKEIWGDFAWLNKIT